MQSSQRSTNWRSSSKVQLSREGRFVDCVVRCADPGADSPFFALRGTLFFVLYNLFGYLIGHYSVVLIL
jgi:hypothetical protein